MLSFARMVTIRTATETDLPALAQLWHEKMVLQTGIALAPSPRAAWVDAAREQLRAPAWHLCVAEIEGAAVGYIAGRVQPMPGLVPDTIGLITEIALDAHGYYGGVGRALVDALRAWFAAQGIVKIAVWTPHFDAVSQAFWRSLGAAEWVDVLWIK